MKNTEQELIRFISFKIDGEEKLVRLIDTLEITDGVLCDTYAFEGDKTKDLGIIKMKPGSRTPLQKVLKGDKTIEGYISGKGKLVITKKDGKREVHSVDNTSEAFSTTIEIGESMQWEADQDSNLVAYEVCFPPYENGRFENLT